jgi:hypothetical protein
MMAGWSNNGTQHARMQKIPKDSKKMAAVREGRSERETKRRKQQQKGKAGR